MIKIPLELQKLMPLSTNKTAYCSKHGVYPVKIFYNPFFGAEKEMDCPRCIEERIRAGGGIGGRGQNNE